MVALVSGLCFAEQRVHYEGYTLYRCEPQTEDQVNQLRLMMEQKVTINVKLKLGRNVRRFTNFLV